MRVQRGNGWQIMANPNDQWPMANPMAMAPNRTMEGTSPTTSPVNTPTKKRSRSQSKERIQRFYNEFQRTRQRHIQYFLHCLRGLPSQYAALDTNRLTLVHFAVQSLDMIGFFDDVEDGNSVHGGGLSFDRQNIVDWIYQLFIPGNTSTNGNACATNSGSTPTNRATESIYGSGFIGGTFLGTSSSSCLHSHHHIAMTYTALCTLITLGDDLTRFDGNDRRNIIQGLRDLQQEDGSFQCNKFGSESDLRFLYCACAISTILNSGENNGDFDTEMGAGFDRMKAVEYVKKCRSWDGGIGLIPEQESHGGSTFCGVASLAMLGVLDDVLDDNDDDTNTPSWRDELIQWCTARQMEGMQGRPNKLQDTCYSYWIGGTLKVLRCDHLLDKDRLQDFIMDCQTDLGGFSKLRLNNSFPDLLHSFYSLAWLSMNVSASDGAYRGDSDEKNNACSDGCDIDSKYNDPLHSIDCLLGMSCRRIETYRELNRNRNLNQT